MTPLFEDPLKTKIPTDFKDTNTTLLFGDCLERMKEIPNNSIDMVLVDLPYGTTSCSWDICIDFKKCWKQLYRIIKKGRPLLFLASQPFTTFLISSNIKQFRYCWVWNKTTAGNPVLAKYQPLKTHEEIVVFGGTSFYFPIMEQREMKKKGGKVVGGKSSGQLKPIQYMNDLYYPKSILTFKTERGNHPTQKPVTLCEYFIKTYTKEEDTVLDFTMGSGSTGVAAKNTHRKFIGIEMDPYYYNMAQQRIQNTL